jgi:chromosome segregation ATPase
MSPIGDLPCSLSVREEVEREKGALRIQAAAVAALQAALTEEEFRLQQYRQALDQHEQQLGSHLEEKRQRLVALRDVAKNAHETLLCERDTFEKRVADALRRLAIKRNETSDGRRQLQTDRQRLLRLGQRLKRRFHHHWANERTAVARRESELSEQVQDLANERERLEREQAALTRTRLHCQAEIEVSRRQLQEEKTLLHKEEHQLRERTAVCDQREAELVEADRQLAGEMEHWEKIRLVLESEVQGLESRISHYRRRIGEQQQEVRRLESALHDLENQRALAHGPTLPIASAPNNTSPTACTAGASGEESECKIRALEEALAERLEYTEKLAGDLADHRLYLAEQLARLAEAHSFFHTDRQAIGVEMDGLARQLEEREQRLRARQEDLDKTEVALRRKAEELVEGRQQLEGWRARTTADAQAWEKEQARASAELRTRQHSVDQKLALVTDLRDRWDKRRRNQVVKIRKLTSSYQKLRQEYLVQREHWLQRRLILDQEQRALAERALAMEQFRQECVVRSSNPKAAEKRLERLRRRYAVAYVAAERTLATERQFLATEAKRVDGQSRELEQQVQELHYQMAEFSARQAEWEQHQVQIELEKSMLQAEIVSLRNQKEHQQQQVRSLQDEVEHLARLLIGDDEPGAEQMPRAA